MTVKSVNPRSPSDVVLETPSSGPKGVEDAVSRARHAFQEWSTLPALQRGQALRKIGDALEEASEELIDLTIREVGKPATETRQELGRAVSIFRVLLAAHPHPGRRGLPIH